MAYDLNNFQFARWESLDIRIYTTHCKFARESEKIGNCSLKDYDFGSDLNKKYDIDIVEASSESECSKKCDQDDICSFSSWKETGQDCQLLKGLRETDDGSGNIHHKRDNPPYFCQKDGAIVTEKESLCKSISDIIHESHGKHYQTCGYTGG